MPRWLFFMILILVLVGTLAACSDNGDDDDDGGGQGPLYTELTVPPPPQVTTLPGCSASEVENWYEVAGANVDRFSMESLDALDNLPEPDQTGPLLQRLIQQRDAINAVNPSECVAPVHSEIVARVNSTVDSFDNYRQGLIDAARLRSEVQQYNDEIEQQKTIFEETTELFEDERRAEIEAEVTAQAGEE
ncbi:MAG: hypothetical protein GYB65_05925 [Chloroflexi bacterium]|nr:hypothetical protein [Chloroflexota bacterium]